jgi:hypothetical protein
MCNVANKQSTLSTALGIFELLGFKYNAEKLEPFKKVATMLGVELDLCGAAEGIIKVQNKPSRVEEVTGCLKGILDQGFIDANQLPSYLGKLQFAEAQLWGRTGRLALADLREATLHKAGTFPVTLESERALTVLLNRFSSGRPRELKASEACKPYVLFTDGALEYDEFDNPKATIGGVLVGTTGSVACFGCNVPEHLVKLWQSDGRTHVIGLVCITKGFSFSPIHGLRMTHWLKALQQCASGELFCWRLRLSTNPILCIFGPPESLLLLTQLILPAEVTFQT